MWSAPTNSVGFLKHRPGNCRPSLPFQASSPCEPFRGTSWQHSTLTWHESEFLGGNKWSMTYGRKAQDPPSDRTAVTVEMVGSPNKKLRIWKVIGKYFTSSQLGPGVSKRMMGRELRKTPKNLDFRMFQNKSPNFLPFKRALNIQNLDQLDEKNLQNLEASRCSVPIGGDLDFLPPFMAK